jgi:hypothetical protein
MDIYGTSTSNKKKKSDCPLLYELILYDMLDLVSITKTVIDKFFPGITVKAPFVAALEAKASINTNVFVLLKWIKIYPGSSLDKNDPNDLLKLKNLYIQLNLPWANDPILREAIELGLI